MKRFSVIFLFVLMLSSCSKIMYFSDQLNEEIIPNFETYSTIDLCDQNVNPIMALRIKNAIDVRMSKQGKSRSDSPEMKIQFFMKDETKLYYSDCGIDYGQWEGGEACRSKVIEYVEGTIVIDFINSKKNEIVWHGAAYGPSFNHIKNSDERINKAVNQLLNKFYASNPQNKEWQY